MNFRLATATLILVLTQSVAGPALAAAGIQ